MWNFVGCRHRYQFYFILFMMLWFKLSHQTHKHHSKGKFIEAGGGEDKKCLNWSLCAKRTIGKSRHRVYFAKTECNVCRQKCKPTKMLGVIIWTNQLPVSAARWQHTSLTMFRNFVQWKIIKLLITQQSLKTREKISAGLESLEF